MLTNCHKFRSRFEKVVCEDLIERNHADTEYEPYAIDYKIPENYHGYTPDFVLPNGIVIECKGWFPLKDRKKMIFVRSSNPHLDIRFVLLKPEIKLMKGSPTTVGQWCTTNHFVWAKETVPEEWIQETGDKFKTRPQRAVDHLLYLSKRKYGPYT